MYIYHYSTPVKKKKMVFEVAHVQGVTVLCVKLVL